MSWLTTVFRRAAAVASPVSGNVSCTLDHSPPERLPAEVAAQLSPCRGGRIQVRDEVHLLFRSQRPRWPVTIWHVALARLWTHARRRGDLCTLDFQRLSGDFEFLVIQLMTSHRNTTMRSVRNTLKMAELVAEHQGAHAVVFQAKNTRLTDRLLARYGYRRHAPQLRGRHFIKRIPCLRVQESSSSS